MNFIVGNAVWFNNKGYTLIKYKAPYYHFQDIKGRLLSAHKSMFTPLSVAEYNQRVSDREKLEIAYNHALSVHASGGGASSADEVSFTPAGNIEATNVQGALEELDAEKPNGVSVYVSATEPEDAEVNDIWIEI